MGDIVKKIKEPLWYTVLRAMTVQSFDNKHKGVDPYTCTEVIHKPCGQIFGHLWPPSSICRTISLNKAYVVICAFAFDKPPPPAGHVH